MINSTIMSPIKKSYKSLSKRPFGPNEKGLNNSIQNIEIFKTEEVLNNEINSLLSLFNDKLLILQNETCSNCVQDSIIKQLKEIKQKIDNLFVGKLKFSDCYCKPYKN